MNSRLLIGLSCLALLTLASGYSPAQDKRLKMRIAVAPLDFDKYEVIADWRIPVEFRNAIHEKLVKKLIDTGRFIVLEREALEALLQEQAIKEANTGQSQKGKVVPAQALVKGKLTDFTIARRGAGGGINIGGIGRVGGSVADAQCAINVRIFNVDTSEVLASEDSSGKASSTSFQFSGNHRVAFADFGAFESSPLGEATTKAIDGAVQKILKKLESVPWSARVADFDASSKEVVINAGSDVGVAAGDVFEVHRVSRVIKDPETGEILGTRTIAVGKIKVTEVEKKIAMAQVVEGTDFTVGDIVRMPR